MRFPGCGRFLAFAAILVVAPVQAKDFAVSSQQEFDAALASAQPGDTLVFKTGVWHDVKLVFRATGEEGRPVTLRAETAGETVFAGASQLTIDGTHLVVTGLHFRNNAGIASIVTPYNVTVASVVTFTQDTSHCRLTETAIVDSGAGVTTYVHLEPGSRSNRVDHCFFSNQGAIGMTFYVEVHPTQPNEHRVDHNYFGDRQPGSGNRWETMRIGHARQQEFVSGTTVAFNLFYRCNGENECVSNKSTGNRFLHNAFIETRGELTLRHGRRAWVEGNYFDAGADPASQGVRVIGSDHVVINNYFKGVRKAVVVYNGDIDPPPTGYLPADNALIAFNTIEDCATVFDLGASGRPVPAKNVRIAYNLVRSLSGGTLFVKSRSVQPQSEHVEVRDEGNILFVAGAEEWGPEIATDSWGRIFPDDPKRLVKMDDVSFPAIAKDIDGEARGPVTNVGAIGKRGVRPLYPLSRKDVGPLWLGREEN